MSQNNYDKEKLKKQIAKNVRIALKIIKNKSDGESKKWMI